VIIGTEPALRKRFDNDYVFFFFFFLLGLSHPETDSTTVQVIVIPIQRVLKLNSVP
jgi:hypothetical protein